MFQKINFVLFFLQKDPKKVLKLRKLILSLNFKGFNFQQRYFSCCWLISIFVSESQQILTTWGRKPDLYQAYILILSPHSVVLCLFFLVLCLLSSVIYPQS